MPLFKAFISFACLLLLLSSMGHCDIPKAPRPAIHASRLAFSPDGKLVVALGVPVKVPVNTPYKYKIENRGVRVWTVADGKIYRSYPWVEADREQLAFSPDSQYLALPSQNTIKIIHLASNRVEATLETPSNRKKFFFSPDGQWLLVKGEWHLDQRAGNNEELFTQYYNIDIWHLGDKYNNITITRQRVEMHSMKVEHWVEYSPDHPPVVRNKPIGPIYWCQNDQPNLWQQAIASDDGKWHAFLYKTPVNTVQIWDAASRTLKYTFPVQEDLPPRTMRFSPTNRWLYISPVFGWEYYHWEFHFWNIAEGTTTRLKPDLGPNNISPVMEVVRSLEGYTDRDIAPTYALSPDENLIAFTRGVSPDTNSNPILNIYDMKTGQRLPADFE